MVSEGRQKRLAANWARFTAEILHTELKQPLPGVVTVTGADVSRDLAQATVYYTFLGSSTERADAARRLRQVAGFVQGEVAHRMHLRITPSLKFEYDPSVAQGSEVLRLLAELRSDEENPEQDS